MGALGNRGGIRTHIFRLKVGCDGRLRYAIKLVALRGFDPRSPGYQPGALATMLQGIKKPALRGGSDPFLLSGLCQHKESPSRLPVALIAFTAVFRS